MHGQQNVRLVIGNFIWQKFTPRYRVTNQIFNTLKSVSTVLKQTHSYFWLSNWKCLFKLSETDGATNFCVRSTPIAKT